jgi:hypothetical protein
MPNVDIRKSLILVEVEFNVYIDADVRNEDAITEKFWKEVKGRDFR